MKTLYTKLCWLLAGGMAVSGCSRYYYEKGNVHYNNMAYSKAALCYEKVAHKENFSEAKNKAAECYRLMNNKEKFEYWYRQLSQAGGLTDSARLKYARVLYDHGKYDEARILLAKHQKKNNAETASLQHALETRDYYYEDSAMYVVKKLSINVSEASSFGATYYKDGIIFSSEIPAGHKSKKCDWTGRNYLDLFFSKISPDGSTGTPEPLIGSVNKDYHEGPATVNKKGNVIYFTGGMYAKRNKPGNNINGINVIRIYRASKINNQWTEVKEVPLINNDIFSVGHPCLSPDEKKLYFISDMEGGRGGTDIYVSLWKDGNWGIPENLGPAVNSEGNEMFPFIAEDGTLYFSSSGFGGLGGLDIFSSIQYNGSWSAPKNMGYPINSFGDDIGFIINRENKSGFFSSNRESPSGIDYLYNFVKPEPVFLVSGVALNKETKAPLSSVPVELMTGQKSFEKIYTDTEGKFTFPLEKGRDYSVIAKNKYSADGVELTTRDKKRSETFKVKLELLDPVITLNGIVIEKENGTPLEGTKVQLHIPGKATVLSEIITHEGGKFSFKLEPGEFYTTYASKENFFTRSADVSTLQKIKTEEIFVWLELDRIVLNKAIRVDNIHYDYNKWFIRDNAKSELDKLVRLMQDNPTIQIELSSHCDSRGSDQHNMKLSQRRAESAVAYILSQGINVARITAKGYGESRLLNECANTIKCSEADHQINRRTEFKVTGITQVTASKSGL